MSGERLNMLFQENLYDMFRCLIFKYNLPEKCLVVRSNISKTGKETSKSIFITEPGFPDSSTTTNNTLILNLKESTNNVTLILRPFLYKFVVISIGNNMIKQRSDKNFYYITFSKEDKQLYECINSSMVYCIENYASSNSFSCCSKYLKCSDEKSCIHENRLYSKGCAYRRNLENGNIFYGNNKTI